jgi:hypothetical protein
MAVDGSWFPNHYTVTPIDRIASATFALRGQHFNVPLPRDNPFCLVSLLGIFSPPSGSKPYLMLSPSRRQ